MTNIKAALDTSSRTTPYEDICIHDQLHCNIAVQLLTTWKSMISLHKTLQKIEKNMCKLIVSLCLMILYKMF